MSPSLPNAAKYVGRLTADCGSYGLRKGLDLVDAGRTLWLRRQRGSAPGRATEIDSKLESIRVGKQTRWSDFLSLPVSRRRLIQVTSWSAAALAVYSGVPSSGPSGLPNSARSGADGGSAAVGRKKVDVWEGEIHAEKRYEGADGLISWTAEYRVRLQEDCFGVENSTYCSLEPLELDYAVGANEVLDKYHYGVYNSRSGEGEVHHNRSVIGKAARVLRLADDAPGGDRLRSNLRGDIYKGRQEPASAPIDREYESEEERYWSSCLAGVPEVTGQPAYRIGINLEAGHGRQDGRSYFDKEEEILNPLLAGIRRSGPDLDSGNGASRSAHAVPVLDLWLCGRMESADDDEIRGAHAFESRHGFGPTTVLFSPDIPSEPVQVSIRWELERTQVELEERTQVESEGPEEPEVPEEALSQPQGSAPADLALQADSPPDRAVPNETIHQRLEIENKGPADAQGVLLVVGLAGAEWIGAEASQGDCSADGDTVSCRLGGIEADDTAEVTLRLVPRVAGTLSSTANVSSALPDPDMSNNLENVVIPVQPSE